MLSVSLTRERPAGEADELRRSERLGAAAHAAQPLLHMQRSDVAPDRRLGRAGQLDQILHGHDRLFLDGGQDDRDGARFRAWFLPCTIIYQHPISVSVNHFQSNILIVQCIMIEFDRF